MPLIELERLSWPVAAAIFVVAAAAVVALGLWSLAGTSAARKWTAIGARLLVVALLVLVIGGARVMRKHEDLEVIVLNDASGSMQLVGDYPGRGKQGGPGTLQEALRRYYLDLTRDANRTENDRLGIVSFRHYARVDELPATSPRGSVAPLAGEGGTDIAAGIRLALATFSPDAMKRLVLVSDGNNNLNPDDLPAAVDAARAQGVPIDVVPLRYDVQNDVMVERFVAPEWKRQNEAFNLLVTLKSTNAGPVTGTLQVVHLGAGVGADSYLDVDPTKEGNARKFRKVTLEKGTNPFEVPVPAQAAAGVHRFRAVFTPDVPGTGGVTAATDSVDRNNSAEAFTIVRGRGQVLFVDGTFRPGMLGEPEGDRLFRTLDRELRGDPAAGGDRDTTPVARVGVEGFPSTPEGLQGYYAVVLYNVSRGGAMTEGGAYGGMSPNQDR
ncbi:MAG TPA: vWA domain-containing protein, partial [Humisphaera sp.]